MVFPPLGIGKINLPTAVVMAPMVGLTVRPYRILALRHECALAAGEMISAEHLVRASAESRSARRLGGRERPSALQLVGADPRVMADAARILEDLGADVVDLNMGCPARRIVRGGGGAALMGDPGLAAHIVRRVRRSVDLPVTVKIRAKGAENEGEPVDLARAVEDAGAAAVAIHARPASARHRGTPRLEAITDVVEALKIPVIGNGGIQSPEDAATMMRTTGCRGVMVGRAAIGDVTLFARIGRSLLSGESLPPPDGDRRVSILEEHLRLMIEEWGEAAGVVRFRRCVPYYLRGVPGVRMARARMVTARSAAEIVAAARRIYLPRSRSGTRGAGTENPRDAR